MKINELKSFVKKSEQMPRSWLRRHGLSSAFGVMIPLGAALAAADAKAAHEVESASQDEFHQGDSVYLPDFTTETDAFTHSGIDSAGFKGYAREILHEFEGSNGWDAIARENVNDCDTSWHGHADQVLQQHSAQEATWLPTAREVFDPMSSQDGSEYSLFNLEADIVGAIFDCDLSCYQMAEAANIDYADYIMTDGDNSGHEVDAGHIHVEFVFNSDGGVLG